MNNEQAQPPEASTSTSEETAGTSIASLAAKSGPKDIIDGLCHDLNNLILITISAVYYLDCFSLLYLFRFLSQNQSTTGGARVVLTTNVICILTHFFHTIQQPAPREFWNHGGMLVDFVGEKPTSRARLIFLDFFILGLQILHLALYYRKSTVDGAAQPKKPALAQDLEAEEAGISRADPRTQVETEEGIEMQSLLPEGTARDGENPRAQVEVVVTLRKQDFKEVFLNPGGSAQSEGSRTAMRQVLDRLNAVRARRTAQENDNSA